MKPTIPVWQVENLHKVIGGDPETEEAIMVFIRRKWGAKSLCYLPENVANEILRRPADFIAKAKKEANNPF